MGSFSVWHWLIVLTLFGCIGFVVYNTVTTKAPAIGLGGWLVLPIIGFFGVILFTAFSVFEALASADYWDVQFNSNVPVLYRIAILASLVFGLAVIASAAASLFFVFRRKAGIKKVATVHYIVLVAAALCDLWADGVIRSYVSDFAGNGQAARTAFRAIMAAGIWIPYFHLSKRVKNTFEGTASSEAAARGLEVGAK